ncbi:MAG: DUF885 family protein [Thermoanaerobaculia bacterium]
MFRRLVSVLAVLAAVPAVAQTPTGYDDLVALFQDWREFQRPFVRDGVPDYSAGAMAAQAAELPRWQARLYAIDRSSWPVAQQIDWHLVRAEMNGLDFDHKVLRPWERMPDFYTVVVDEQSDTPLREGPIMAGALELWRYDFPLDAEGLAAVGASLRAAPALLAAARENLTGDARDLWRIGIRGAHEQVTSLERLRDRLAEHHPELVPDAEAARDAMASFASWLEEKLPEKHGTSGVGVLAYDWYLANVHLVPMTWQDEMRLMQRELARSRAYLALHEHDDRDLPPLEPAATPEEWDRRANEAVTRFVAFLDGEDVMTVEEWMEPALRERIAGYLAPDDRHFFAQVEMREPLLMRCHQVHWIDTARFREQPHPSPIRREPLLYNIWDNRSEGFATAMEEMMTGAGLLDDRPRGREMTDMMVAMRAARAISGLRMHSNEWTLDEAMEHAAAEVPRGWLRRGGDLVWFEQSLYLEQPGYGTSYITGKALIEDLLSERAHQLGDDFTLHRFMDELYASGVIPVSLIRWEMTGNRDRILQ